MIEVARSKNMEGVELVVGDCENLPFADDSYDVVICCQSFHHYPNVQDFFNSVFRVLRPGGRLILRDMTMNSAAIRWFCNHIELPLAKLVLAVTLHNIPEGMAVGIVCAGWMYGNQEITYMGAVALALGIAIQNFPEGAICFAAGFVLMMALDVGLG